MAHFKKKYLVICRNCEITPIRISISPSKDRTAYLELFNGEVSSSIRNRRVIQGVLLACACCTHVDSVFTFLTRM